MSRLRAVAIPVAQIIGAIVSIQAGAALAKTLFPVFGAEGTTALRLLLASLILCAVYRPWQDTHLWRDPKARRLLLIYGATLGVMNLLFYVALRGLPLGIAVAIEFLGPLAVAVLGSRRALDFLWAALAVLGLALLLPFAQSSTSLPFASVIAALGAATAWALYIVFGQKLGRHANVNAGRSVTWGMLIATCVAVPAGLGAANSAWLDVQWLWPALIVALLSSAIPYPLEMRALQKLPVRTFGILMSLEPAIAAIAGLIVLGETLSPAQQIAVGCVMLASAGTAITARAEVRTQ